MESDLYGQSSVEVLDQIDRQMKPLGDLALKRLNLKAGDRVIDVGCGGAQTCLQIAERVGASGYVLGVDVSPSLVEAAKNRTEHSNEVQIVQGDIHDYPFEGGTFDALYSRFGVMAFSDPVRAFANVFRALKPCGELSFVCWRPFVENEIDYLPVEAAKPVLPSHLIETLTDAAPFSFSNPDTVRSILAKTGFKDIALQAQTVPVSAGGIEETLELCLRVGMLGRLLRSAPALRPDIERPLRDALEARSSPDGVFMEAAVWIVTARK